ncbi:hypothetical protein NGA_2107500, partial [Nannochloropsis gaditana CCMP526]|uniref:uncharacterized protein n=1 Tax=Nannochloropsis gaditana (strain CCMP526) TaxID=1093141 RepID=UPI00029F6129
REGRREGHPQAHAHVDYDPVLAVNQDVLQTHVPMAETSVVHEGQARQNLRKKRPGPGLGQAAPPR